MKKKSLIDVQKLKEKYLNKSTNTLEACERLEEILLNVQGFEEEVEVYLKEIKNLKRLFKLRQLNKLNKKIIIEYRQDIKYIEQYLPCLYSQ